MAIQNCERLQAAKTVSELQALWKTIALNSKNEKVRAQGKRAFNEQLAILKAQPKKSTVNQLIDFPSEGNAQKSDDQPEDRTLLVVLLIVAGVFLLGVRK